MVVYVLGGSLCSSYTFVQILFSLVRIETYVTSRRSFPLDWAFLKLSLVEMRSLETGIPSMLPCYRRSWCYVSYFQSHWYVMRHELVFEWYRQHISLIWHRLESFVNCLESYNQCFEYPLQHPSILYYAPSHMCNDLIQLDHALSQMVRLFRRLRKSMGQ